MITKYVLPLFALALLGFAVQQVLQSRQPVPTPQLLMQPPRAPYQNRLAGSGIVEPIFENISIGSATAGIVTAVDVQVGQKVKKGDPLFRLDDRQLQAELKVRQSAVVAADADLKRLKEEPRKEQLPVYEASVREMEASLADMNDQLKRTSDLYAKRVAQEEQLIRMQKQQQQAASRLAKANAEFALLKAGAWDADISVAQAAVDRAQVQVEQTKTEIERLTVKALTDGEVLQVNVRPGEYVGMQPGQANIVLGDVNELHVRVDIDEHDIPRFVPGTKAQASLRGRSTETFPMSFVRVEPFVVPKKSLTGQNTERVDTRVLQVIYAVDPTDKKLYVGQQVDVFIMADASKPETFALPDARTPPAGATTAPTGATTLPVGATTAPTTSTLPASETVPAASAIPAPASDPSNGLLPPSASEPSAETPQDSALPEKSK
ncbi:MAG TPA: efflux RND transporter periplasmic adaptor subunit [Pirellulales bacterium]|jgi:multidrug resistance efflux pump|nr:efflux RND transporter periplasmic adaptor subunit [Pirellulales bacterium]